MSDRRGHNGRHGQSRVNPARGPGTIWRTRGRWCTIWVIWRRGNIVDQDTVEDLIMPLGEALVGDPLDSMDPRWRCLDFQGAPPLPLTLSRFLYRLLAQMTSPSTFRRHATTDDGDERDEQKQS